MAKKYIPKSRTLPYKEAVSLLIDVAAYHKARGTDSKYMTRKHGAGWAVFEVITVPDDDGSSENRSASE